MPQSERAAPAYALIAGGRAIQCLTCLLISFHYLDVAQRYCGRCHRIHRIHLDPGPGSQAPLGGARC